MGLKVSSVTGEGLSEQGHPLGSAGGSGWISSCEQTNTHEESSRTGEPLLRQQLRGSPGMQGVGMAGM